MTSCLLDGALHLDIQQWGLSSTVWISLRNYPQQPKLSSPVYFSVIINSSDSTSSSSSIELLLLSLWAFFQLSHLLFELSSQEVFTKFFREFFSESSCLSHVIVNDYAAIDNVHWNATLYRYTYRGAKQQGLYPIHIRCQHMFGGETYKWKNAWCLSRAPSEVRTRVQTSKGCPRSHTKYQYTMSLLYSW